VYEGGTTTQRRAARPASSGSRVRAPSFLLDRQNAHKLLLLVDLGERQPEVDRPPLAELEEVADRVPSLPRLKALLAR